MTRKDEDSKNSKEESAYQDQLSLAHARIGHTVNQATEWLLRFTQLELSLLSEGAVVDLGYELNCVGDFLFATSPEDAEIRFSSLDWEGKERFTKKHLKESPLGYLTELFADSPGRRPPMNRPTPETINRLQRFVKEQLEHLLEKKSVAVILPPPIHIQAVAVPSSNFIGVVSVATTPKDIFIHNAIILLFRCAAMIRQCPECRKHFLADRSNKMNCSVLCQNRAAVRKLRQSLPKRNARRGRPPGSKNATPSPQRGKP